MITDIHRSVKRKSTLQDYMEIINTHFRKVIKYVFKRWQSLDKGLDRTLTQWDALKSYFVSNFDLNDGVYDDEENGNAGPREKRYMRFCPEN